MFSREESSQGRVKCALSADTVVIETINGPGGSRDEKVFSFAFVNGPRMKREGDEPWAIQARDFLRRLAVGKVVQFVTLYTNPGGRENGLIFFSDGQNSLPDVSVKEGWLKLRDDATKKLDSDRLQKIYDGLRQSEEEAKESEVGLWSPGPAPDMKVRYEVSDPNEIVETWKGKPIPGLVEKVITGDRLIVRFLFSPTDHLNTLVALAGVRAPSTKRVVDGKEVPGEPYSQEAFDSVESKTLQRQVDIDVVGVTPNKLLICTIIHRVKGIVAEHLLAEGYFRCNDSHSTLLGGEMMSKLRSAERRAKDRGLGLFKGLSKAKSSGAEHDATVTRVQTADTLYIKDKTGQEKRVSMSSIRQPKPSDPKQAPFQAEAKEFVRRKLIGKHVKFQVDGKKEANEGFEARDVVTVTLNDKNVAVQIVEAGFATVIRHRHDDTDRSPVYDDLLAAESAAQAEQKGLWSSKPPASKSYQDFSENLQKAKIQASVLQRQKRIPAIVDYVKGGSRFTLIIPRENAKLTFVLSGIRTPRSARNANEKSEPYGQEAHDFANRRCNQRDVEIDIDGVDKVGGFIGSLFVNRENFAKSLLEEGFANTHAFSAEQSGHGPELFNAEDSAKKARKGLWHDYDPSITDGFENLEIADMTAGSNSNGDTAPIKKDYRDVLVSHIDAATLHLKLQQIGPATSGALTKLMSAFATHQRSPPTNEKALSGPPKTGDIVAARFSEDKEWYRARVRRNDREAKKSDVLFIDYGNSETLPWSELRPINPQGSFGLSSLRPQAIDVGLSYVQFPVSQGYIDDAASFLRELAEGRTFVASVDFEEKDGGLWATLFDAEKPDATEVESLNKVVIEEGLGMVGRKLRPWEAKRGASKILPSLKKAEEAAKSERRGMWEYGDVSED